MEQEATYVGIEVAKFQVDVAARPAGDVWRFDYNEAGIASLIARLQSLNSTTVLLEATGGIELPLVAALAAQHCHLSWSTPPGQGLCQGYRQAGQDGRVGCRRPSPVC